MILTALRKKGLQDKQLLQRVVRLQVSVVLDH
jgi:hypothetical protein